MRERERKAACPSTINDDGGIEREVRRSEGAKRVQACFVWGRQADAGVSRCQV